MDRRRFLTKREAAVELRVSDRTIERMVRSGVLPAYRLGGRPGGTIRIEANELRERVASWRSE
jgi:excisionase family DNA binding protein